MKRTVLILAAFLASAAGAHAQQGRGSPLGQPGLAPQRPPVYGPGAQPAVPDGLRILQGFNPALNYYFNRADREQLRALEARAQQDQREIDQAQRSLDVLADPYAAIPVDQRPATFRNLTPYFNDTQGYFPPPPQPRRR